MPNLQVLKYSSPAYSPTKALYKEEIAHDDLRLLIGFQSYFLCLFHGQVHEAARALFLPSLLGLSLYISSLVLTC